MAKEFYVYELVDPRTEKPFYIGKGKGDRIHQHERNAKRDKSSHKNNKILQIHNDGLEVTKNIVKWFVSEDAAYNYERKLIQKIGIDNLTNVAPGGRALGPYYNKKDEKLEYDRQLISVYALFIRKTGLNGEYGFRFLGKLIPVDSRLFPMLKQKLKAIMQERSFEWAVKEFKKNNINLMLASKVDNYG